MEQEAKYYTSRDFDLISFGNYLLSDERRKSFLEMDAEFNHAEPADERLKGVHHADLENWKAKQGFKSLSNVEQPKAWWQVEYEDELKEKANKDLENG